MSGIAFAILSPMFLGGTFLFSEIVLGTLNTRSFMLFWMTAGGIYATAAFLLRRPQALPERWLPRLGLIGVGLLELLTSYAFFTAIGVAKQPAVVAFLAQLSMVLTIILSIVVLKERIAARAITGIALLVAGLLLLSYASGEVGWLLLLLMVVATTGLSFGVILSKAVVRFSNPWTMLVVRNWVTAFGALALLPGELQFPSADNWRLIAIGAFIGPFGSFLFRFLALDRIDAWTVAAYAMALPLFVSVYDRVFLGLPLSPSQVLAGTIILSGSYIVGRELAVSEPTSAPQIGS